MDVQYLIVGFVIVAAILFAVKGTVRRIRPLVSENGCEADCGCSSSDSSSDSIPG